MKKGDSNKQTKRELMRRDAIRIKAHKDLDMRSKFFLIDVISLLERGYDLTEKQQKWFSNLKRKYASKDEQRIEATIAALRLARELDKEDASGIIY